jgi:hypothetical protein
MAARGRRLQANAIARLGATAAIVATLRRMGSGGFRSPSAALVTGTQLPKGLSKTALSAPCRVV